MEAKQRRISLPGTAASVALALGGLGLASAAGAQQATTTPGGSPTEAEQTAAKELREARAEIRDAGEQITEARQQSTEAVREGREASRAAQASAREQQDEQRELSGTASDTTSGAAERTRTATAGSGSTSGTTSTGGSMSSGSSSGSSSGGGSAQANSQRGSASAPEAVWLWVPVAVSARTEQQSNDCWVRLYSGENFDGRYITITGPAELPELHSPYGTGLNNWESAIVGRNATVTTYDGDNFAERSATLRGGQRYADLGDQKLGLFEDIESIRVNCNSTGGGR